MSGFDLHAELFDAMQRVDESMEQFNEAGASLAEAEREYRIQKRMRILYYRDQGMPATLTLDVVNGCEDIANLRFNRDCKEAEYGATREAVLWGKKKVDVLRELIAREWGHDA